MLLLFANAIIAPSLPLIQAAFAEIPNAELLVKLMLTIPALTVAVISPFIGRLVDTWGRKKVLISSLIIFTLAGTSGSWLNSLTLILIGRFVLGFGVSGIMTSTTTLIGDYFDGSERSSFFGLQGVFFALGGLVFITLAGFLANFNWRYPFLIYASSSLFIIPVIIYLYEPNRTKVAAESIAPRQIEYEKSAIWMIYASVFVVMLFYYVIPVQLPFFVATFEGTTTTMAGFAIGFQSMIQAVSALMYKRLKKRFTFVVIFALCFLFLGLGFFFLSLSRSFTGIVGSVFMIGFGMGWLLPNANLWLISKTPESVRGKFVGYLGTFAFLGMFFSPLFFQPIKALIGIQSAFIVLSAILGIVSLLYFCLNKKFD